MASQDRLQPGQLAKVLNVEVMTISRWETGLRSIPPFLHLALRCPEIKDDPSSAGYTREGRK